MQLFNLVAALSLSLAFWARAVSAQLVLTELLYPSPGTQLTPGSNITVQVGIGGYPENVDIVAIVIGLAHCYGPCQPASAFVGTPLYQGPYTPVQYRSYANYTVTVPEGYPTGSASLNVVNFFLVGAEYEPVVNYLNETVTVV